MRHISKRNKNRLYIHGVCPFKLGIDSSVDCYERTAVWCMVIVVSLKLRCYAANVRIIRKSCKLPVLPQVIVKPFHYPGIIAAYQLQNSPRYRRQNEHTEKQGNGNAPYNLSALIS